MSEYKKPADSVDTPCMAFTWPPEPQLVVQGLGTYHMPGLVRVLDWLSPPFWGP